MYLLITCGTAWLCLLGAFTTTWTLLPSPRSTTDLVVIIVVGAAALAFTRLGAVSLLALLIRALPAGRFRTGATAAALRLVPALLRSSVLAAASASLTVGAAHAVPLPPDAIAAVCADQTTTKAVTADTMTAEPGTPVGPRATSEPPSDPGWPTVPNEPTSPPSPTAPEMPTETHPPVPLDPGWPSSPPSDSDVDTSPESGPDDGAPDAREPTTGEPAAPQPGPESQTHIVAEGESLWSIAAGFSGSNSAASDLADEIYADNRDMIGADPNLIMPGQRLEIQP